MTTGSPLRTIDELESSAHICCIYETEEEHQNLLVNFLRQGIERGEKILYLTDGQTINKLRELLFDNGFEVDTLIKTGQLIFFTADETFIHDGFLDTERIIVLLQNETKGALAGGYTGLRAIKEMASVLESKENYDRYIEYETKLNSFFPNSNCSIICQYDRQSLDSKLLLDLLASHPMAMIGNDIYDNFAYLTPVDNKTEDKTSILLHNLLDNFTLRKRTEVALRESDNKYKSLVEKSIQGTIIVQGTPPRIIFSNPAFAKIFKLSINELLGLPYQKLIELIHPDDKEVVIKSYQNRLAGKSSRQNYEFRIILKDGTERWLSMAASKIEYNNQPSIQATFIDITERKHAIEQLKLRLKLEKTISNISSHFIGFSDINDAINISLAELGKMRGASRTYLFLFKEDGHLMDNTHEWCDKGVTPQIDNLKDMAVEDFPWWMKKLKNGEIIHIKDVSKLSKAARSEKEILECQGIKSLIVLPLNIKRKLAGFIGFDNVAETGEWGEIDINLLRTSSDIIERALEHNQAENEISKYRKHLEELVKERTSELESFTFTVSHDLKAPLRTIQSFGQILLEENSEKLDAESKNYLSRIVESSQNLINIIQDLLRYSQLSKIELELEPVSLDAVVKDVIGQLESEIHESDADLRVVYPLANVIGHETTLIKAISNLLVNAITFVKTDVKPEIKIFAEVKDDQLRLCVKDNGIGIKPEYQEQIFRIFERLYGCEAFAGTGIGLAIVKKGIERLGGKVGVESVLGQGSTFWIELKQA